MFDQFLEVKLTGYIRSMGFRISLLPPHRAFPKCTLEISADKRPAPVSMLPLL